MFWKSINKSPVQFSFTVCFYLAFGEMYTENVCQKINHHHIIDLDPRRNKQINRISRERTHTGIIFSVCPYLFIHSILLSREGRNEWRKKYSNNQTKTGEEDWFLNFSNWRSVCALLKLRWKIKVKLNCKFSLTESLL